MKKLLVLIIIGLVIVQGCKKEDPNSNGQIVTQTGSKAKFQTSIQDIMNPCSITEDADNNILVLGNKEGKISLIKIDTSGNVIWNKSYQSLTGFATKVIAMNDNSIVITSVQDNTIEPITNLPNIVNAWIQNSNTSIVNCNPTYEMGSIDGHTVKSKSFVSRLDKDGNILWTNTYDECIGNGKSIVKNTNGNINLVTMKLKGRVPILIYDNFGVFQDTINYPENDNTVNVYELDKNGNLLWKKEIMNIYNRGYDQLSSNLDLQITNNSLVVKTEKNTFYINLATKLVKDYVNHSEYASNYNMALSGKSSSVILSGFYVTIDTFTMSYKFNYYIQKMDESQNIVWEFANSDIIIDNNGTRFIALNIDSSSINIYDNNCTFIKGFATPASHIGMINCNNGITAVKNINNQIIVTRTNSLGEY